MPARFFVSTATLLLVACLYPSYSFDLIVAGTSEGGSSGGTWGEELGGTTASLGGSSANGGTMVAGGGRPGSAGSAGSAGSVGGGSGGGAPAPSYCPTSVDPTVLVVDGNTGKDQNVGSCVRPLRTLNEALKRVRSAPAITTIRLLGGPPGGTPIVYSNATNGETLPVVLDTVGLTLRGDGQDRTVLLGSGDCPTTGYYDDLPRVTRCLLHVTASSLRLSDLSIRSSSGSGVFVNGVAGLLVERVRVSDCAAVGIVSERGSFSLRDSTVTQNGVGIAFLQFAGGSSLQNAVVSNNQKEGLLTLGLEGTLTLRDLKVASNGAGGVKILGNGQTDGRVSLTNSQIKGNQGDGIFCSGSGSSYGTTTFDMVNSRVEQNTANGLVLRETGNLKVRGSTLLGNTEAGVHIMTANGFGDSRLKPDLGQSAADPGNNVLQAATGGNLAGGVCRTDKAGPMNAVGNRWAVCPVKANPNQSCTNGVDLGGDQVINADLCQVAP